MEANRQELRQLLLDVLEEAGETAKLYYQSPESVKLEYPCVIYKMGTFDSRYADNSPYKIVVRFDVTYITRSPTSKIPSLLVTKPGMAFDRYYVADNLHHYAYTYISNLKEDPND